MNRNFRNIGLSLAVILGLAACGSGGSNDSGTATSDVSIRFSDAPIGELDKVVITVDKLIFNREGTDIEVDTFTSEELSLTDSDTFQIDLLEVQGLNNKLVLDSVTLPVGDYQNLRIKVLDGDTDLTYVVEEGSVEQKELKVPSGELKLGQFSVSNDSSQTFVVEFALNQAMTYNPKKGMGGKDRYILKPRGVRVVRLEDASHIAGVVDWASINAREGCTEVVDPATEYRVYLYAGHGLDTNLLGDLFVRQDDSTQFNEFDPDVPADIIAPVASAPIDGGTGEYLFSYLKPGNYTLAISCAAAVDDPVIFDAITIPAPAEQLIELELNNETTLECNFPDSDACTVES